MSRPAHVSNQPPVHWIPGFFREDKAAGTLRLTIHLHVALRLRMNGAKPQLLAHAFMTWTRAVNIFALPFIRYKQHCKL